tara:strand:+ start:214 stop:429 length:216 start_codon:yes stop_codon:yes gene_type:complete
MQIIREVFPNNMPFMIEGVIDNEGIVEPDSVKMFPIISPPEMPAFVGEPFQLKNNKLAKRLNHILHTNDTT